MLDQRAAKKTSLLKSADGGALMERVVSDGFDGLENGEAATAEHFQINTKTFVDQFRERHALGKQSASAAEQILHQTDVAFVKAALNDVLLAKTLASSSVERNVDAPFFKVARDVLPEICKLQGGAGRVGQALALLVTIAAKIKDQPPDRVGGVNAVAENRVPIGVALGRLILPKCL